MMLKADFHTHTTYCDGKNTPAEMVKAAYGMGGRIIIKSDSHAANTIGYHFDQAVKVARSCGFDRTLILKPGGGFREIYLP